jgi:hypothetical protein
MHEFDRTSADEIKKERERVNFIQIKECLLQQHDNQVKYPLNLMLLYDDQVYVDKLLYFHVKDQEPKRINQLYLNKKMKFFVTATYFFNESNNLFR